MSQSEDVSCSNCSSLIAVVNRLIESSDEARKSSDEARKSVERMLVRERNLNQDLNDELIRLRSLASKKLSEAVPRISAQKNRRQSKERFAGSQSHGSGVTARGVIFQPDPNDQASNN